MARTPLSSLEIATGAVVGVLPGDAATPALALAGDSGMADAEPPRNPRAELERAILPALLRPPCLVSFSGGRDSSAVLAAASSLALREGLAAPIPATNVFPAAAGTQERRWQEQVVAHLGLTEWLRIEHTDELDLIGPYAQRVMSEQELVWPPNVHFHLPLLDAARGGSLLSGVGGDELLAASRRPRAAAVLHGAVRPRPRDALSIGLAFAPRRLRRPVMARRQRIDAAWLRAPARRRVCALVAEQAAAEPRGLRERMAWWRRLRYLGVGVAALQQTAVLPDVLLVHPLLCERVWSAVASTAAPCGFADRAAGMRQLFGDLLPESSIARSDKARFDEAFWTARAARFAAEWDGRGAPEEWVDSRALSEHWRRGRPSAQSFTLLQALWLQAGARRAA